MATELEVLLHGKHAGHLVETTPFDWRFVYAPVARDAAPSEIAPVSLALPRSRERHYGTAVRAVFSNLLPDGALKMRLAQSLGLSEGNDFGLLARVGSECAGAIRLRQPGGLWSGVRSQKVLDDEQLRNIIAVLPLHPLLADADNLSKTLPGEFDKLPVRLANGQIRIVLGDELTTHVLKPAKPGLKETVFNEAFCMQLAAAYGLPVAEVRLVHGKVSSLLVTRVDRVVEQTVKTVQIEDFCQALGHLSGRKYEREGGPRLEDIARLLRSVSATPAQDLRALINWVLFGFFIGFGAAHGKQVALTHGTTAPSMSPFYGIWSTHVYPQMSFRMGFRIGDEDRPDWLSIARWREFADAIGVRPAFVIAALERSALALPGLARETAEAFQRRHGFAEIVRSITALIDQRARQTLVALEADEQKR